MMGYEANRLGNPPRCKHPKILGILLQTVPLTLHNLHPHPYPRVKSMQEPRLAAKRRVNKKYSIVSGHLHGNILSRAPQRNIPRLQSDKYKVYSP